MSNIEDEIFIPRRNLEEEIITPPPEDVFLTLPPRETYPERRPRPLNLRLFKHSSSTLKAKDQTSLVREQIVTYSTQE